MCYRRIRSSMDIGCCFSLGVLYMERPVQGSRTLSARAELVRISSPMATVIYTEVLDRSLWLRMKQSRVRTSLSILTFALIPSISDSFCDSSDERTASEYCPLYELVSMEIYPSLFSCRIAFHVLRIRRRSPISTTA